MRALSCSLLVLGFLCARSSLAGDLPGTLALNDAPRFEGFYHQVYEFTADGSAGAFVAVLSQDFDAYLMVVDPNGEVQTNDDHNIELSEAKSSDAALSLEGGASGRWTLVATSYGPNASGDFTVRYQGASEFRQLDPAEMDSALVERAFSERDVLTTAARERRAGVARIREIDALVERLSLPSYREELVDTLRDEVESKDKHYTEARARVSELERREQALLAAMDHSAEMTRSREVIAALVERELDSVRFDAERQASQASQAFGERETFQHALEALERLDSVAAALQRAEARLLSTIDLGELAVARDQVSGLRAERSVLSREIAERLLDSEMLKHLRFGRLNGLPVSVGWANVPLPIVDNAGMMLQESVAIVASMAVASEWAMEAADVEIDVSVWLPSLLPWPPPDASAQAVIGPAFLSSGGGAPQTLGDVDAVLTQALAAAGYHGSSYLGVPEGFAIISRIEQTDVHGAPLEGKARWSARIELMKSFSIIEYLRALLTAPAGYFRVLTLIVSSEPFTSSGERMRLATLERWSRQGLNVLPPEVRSQPYSADYRVTALIYEFEKAEETDQPQVHIPGRLTAAEHLVHIRLDSFLL